uniref:HAP1 N-terminal domain-containing protein n=1 Tax=Ascaris lumbricoides TaxID=6252 RepID=A0A9J2Q5V8_ASCLU
LSIGCRRSPAGRRRSLFLSQVVSTSAIAHVRASSHRESPSLVAVSSDNSANFQPAFIFVFQKEKDLELAAKIGQSLLEQNRELQNRNDFLEESLNASNDTVVQLRHELQMRINLLHIYADYDDDHEACGSRYCFVLILLIDGFY